MTDLVPFKETQAVAQAMAQSGFFSDARDVNQAIVKIIAGQELGLGPFASMTGIHIIKGKPVMGANLIATLIKQDPRYDYRVTRHDDDGCTIVFFENGEAVGESSFTQEDAKKAQTWDDKKKTFVPLSSKFNWQSYPRNMMFARAISNGAKWYTPGIFGGAPVYTADELGEEIDGETGEIVNVTPPRQIEAPRPEPQQNGNGDEWIQPVTISTRSPLFKKFQKLGTEFYGDEWDEMRPKWASELSDGRTNSSAELTVEEVQKAVIILEKRIEKKLAEDERV